MASAEIPSARALIGAVAAALLTVIGITALSVAPRPGRAVAVLTWPGHAGDSVEVIARAGGELLASGAGGFIIAQSADEGFVGRLYGAGALLVVDAAAAPLCAGSNILFARRGR